MKKNKTKFVCQECGAESPKWLGKCPGCGSWNTYVEEKVPSSRASGGFGRGFDGAGGAGGTRERPQPMSRIEGADAPRIDAGSGELNRVLGGGLVPGSLILVGGDPGIGKSTLLLQTSHALARSGMKVLYVSGEESARQIKMRAERIGALAETLLVLCETNTDHILEALDEVNPDVLVVDSIQTVYQPEVASAPGSVSQVRECTGLFMRVAKQRGTATMLVGHVTKEGAIAGPRLLEHMVDTVLYFEGERHNAYRMLRAVKNRFGSTNEIGIFEMVENGLSDVKNPSELFLSERPVGAAGSTVVAAMEGTRPVLVELQALVAATTFPAPRRTANGVDYNRLNLIIAVLEKRVGMHLATQDAYLNVAGGVRLDEPAADLGIAVALASSFRDKPTRPEDVVFGEIGLTGEVRGVSRVDQRVNEALKLGFRRVVLPEKSMRQWTPPRGIEIVPVATIREALAALLP